MKAYNSDITIEEFIARHATPYDPDTDNYFREPFARDTKVGKNSAIYNAHSYHTKVPPEGIVPYILHYTQPGDLVLDPFCGSGMTGVAAMMYAQPPKGVIIPAGAKHGARKAILNDLSPAACHAETFVLWDRATDRERGEVPDEIACPTCGIAAKKSKFRRCGLEFKPDSLEFSVIKTRLMAIRAEKRQADLPNTRPVLRRR